jgi:hypothetical protein
VGALTEPRAFGLVRARWRFPLCLFAFFARLAFSRLSLFRLFPALAFVTIFRRFRLFGGNFLWPLVFW